MYRKIRLTVNVSVIAVALVVACAPAQPPATTPTEAPLETLTVAPSETPGPKATATPMVEPTATIASPIPTRVDLELMAEGLNSPVTLVSPGDGSGRLFVVDRVGLVYVLTAERDLLEEPFLDVRDRMVELRENYDERGLLGLAVHPDFGENGRFFVYYSAPLREDGPQGWDHTAHISEFAVSAGDPNKADAKSERVLLQVDEPQFNHDGGQVVFGPDSYLYISLGDGGGANDVATGHGLSGNGQDPTTLLGSVLRIDVDSGDPYGIPSDNPFVDSDEGADEVFAYGLRNPWRMSFDAGGEHELYVADVGQNMWEEVSVVTLGGNYGWNIKEGTHCFDHRNPDVSPEECPDTGLNGEALIGPIIEYGHPDLPSGIGTTVIGGFVYRGTALTDLQGQYVFGDWSTSFAMPDGQLLVATAPGSEGDLWSVAPLLVASHEDGRPHAFVLGFGQDAENELYVLTTDTTGPTGETGKVWKIVPRM